MHRLLEIGIANAAKIVDRAITSPVEQAAIIEIKSLEPNRRTGRSLYGRSADVGNLWQPWLKDEDIGPAGGDRVTRVGSPPGIAGLQTGAIREAKGTAQTVARRAIEAKTARRARGNVGRQWTGLFDRINIVD